METGNKIYPLESIATILKVTLESSFFSVQTYSWIITFSDSQMYKLLRLQNFTLLRIYIYISHP